ncbi:MAG: DUF2207 domain-containing protein [Clostridia bacterium]|nr:DUF2207 domain-containing protein [Clostridia bacterium]
MKQKFLRLFGALLATACLLVTAVLPSFAWGGSGEYYSIDVQVTLLEDGTAQVIELWDVELDDDWSELYVPKTNLGEMKIRNMQVKELTDGSEYTYIGEDWDVGSGMSTEDKRLMKHQKCGIAQRSDGGVELCWGVSGEGRHKYQLSYLMSNVVQKYSDGYDGFNIRFINSSLSPAPDHVSVTIDTQDVEELTKDNTKFWAFGLMGTTRLEDGKVIVESDQNGTINYCNVMCRFDEGIFDPAVETGTTFRSLVEKAFVGSDYDISAYDDGTSGGDGVASDTTLVDDLSSDEDLAPFFSEDGTFNLRDLFMAFLIPAGALLVFIFGIGKLLMGKGTASVSRSGLLSRISSTITRKEKKDVLYSRDIPLDGSLPEAYLALDTMDELPAKGAIIEAYLLKWMKNGWARVEEQPEKRLGGLLSDKMAPTIVFPKEAAEETNGKMSGVEEQLWNILHAAAGNDDILQEKELKYYAEAHYERLENFFEDTLNEGMRSAKASGRVEDIAEKKLLFTSHRTVLTEDGKKKFLDLLGLRKFLKEFTIINERQARDVNLWGDYLTYAALFGIAEEVAEQFKELVPDFFSNPQAYGYYGAGWDTYDMLWMMAMMNRFSNTAYNSYMAGRSAQEIQMSSSGGGGFSSFGGGGGFSGGGIGGGGR